MLRIDGLLSGTLGYVTDELARGGRFSEIVRCAHELGYTEPDPREDLFGSDVERKLLILGRLAGVELEPHNVALEDRDRDSPLVVRGPGAGPEVTAAGVLADILRAIVEST